MSVTIDDLDLFPGDLPYTIQRSILSGTKNTQLNHGNITSSQSWARPYFSYNIEYSVLDFEEQMEIQNFLIAHWFDPSGIDYFLFEDPTYHTEENTKFGKGDGDSILYRLKLNYNSGNREFKHPKGWIKKDSEIIYINGNEVDKADYSIDYSTGTVNFDIIPDDGDELTADFNFYRKCKMDDNQYSSNARSEVYATSSITIRETS